MTYEPEPKLKIWKCNILLVSCVSKRSGVILKWLFA